MKGLKMFSVFSLLLSTPAFAVTEFGICHYGNENLSSMICYGPALLKETMIDGDVKVAGPLKAVHASMGTLRIAGKAELEHCTIKGAAMVTGLLNATGVNFEKNLTIEANNVLLHHSTIKGSLQLSTTQQKPTIKLDCASTVMGSVTFTDAPGIVQMTEDSVVTGGVRNGVVETIDSKCSS